MALRRAIFHLPSSIFHLRWLPLTLVAWLVLVEAGTALWYRSSEQRDAGTKGWSVSLNVTDPAVTKVEIPPNILGAFKADQSLKGCWQDAADCFWELYYFRWFPPRSPEQRGAIEMARSHRPEICLPAVGMTLKSYLGVITVPVAGMELAMQQYVFAAEGRTLHVFYGIYEDHTGSAVLANRRLDRAIRIQAALGGSRNSGQRYLEVALFSNEPPEAARVALVRELGKLIQRPK